MTNINWSSFVNNFANNFNRTNVNNVQNNLLNETFVQGIQQTNGNQTILPNTMNQLVQANAEFALLNQSQMAEMLKELLGFPKNMEDILTKLMTNQILNTQESALMMLASSMNLDSLAILLQNNSKEGMTNLYQMLAQFNQIGMSLKDEQLGHLTKLISLVGSSANSPTQSLKTIMLMYLPWLPLSEREAFKLEIREKNSNNESGNEDSVMILISTENFGNLQANIYKTSKDGIKIEAITSQTFPQKEFIELMKEESKKYSININFELAYKEEFNKEKNKESKTEICMNTSPGVNLFLILISNAVIKNIHNIDAKENLRNSRKEKIENGKS